MLPPAVVRNPNSHVPPHNAVPMLHHWVFQWTKYYPSALYRRRPTFDDGNACCCYCCCCNFDCCCWHLCTERSWWQFCKADEKFVKLVKLNIEVGFLLSDSCKNNNFIKKNLKNIIYFVVS